MIATAPDFSPAVKVEIVPVLGASLMTPLEPGDEPTMVPLERSTKDPETEDDESNGVAEPVRVPRPTVSRRMMETPSTHDSKEAASHPYLRESRLPREVPPVLIR